MIPIHTQCYSKTLLSISTGNQSSSGTIDGYVTHTVGGGASWSTIQGGAGTTAATGGTELLAYIQEGSGSDWIAIYRGPAGFNCASINDSHEVKSATMTGRPNQVPQYQWMQLLLGRQDCLAIQITRSLHTLEAQVLPLTSDGTQPMLLLQRV